MKSYQKMPYKLYQMFVSLLDLGPLYENMYLPPWPVGPGLLSTSPHINSSSTSQPLFLLTLLRMTWASAVCFNWLEILPTLLMCICN